MKFANESWAARFPGTSLKSSVTGHTKAREIGRFAVARYGEDGELSFAGLHQTVLNVPPGRLLEAYKIVLASLYSPEAISYRHQMGILEDESAMSVLCQEMVDSQASGILQTVCPESTPPGCMAIYASFGLGRTTAEGRDALDQYIVGKEPPYEIRESNIAEKKFVSWSAAEGGEDGIRFSAKRSHETCHFSSRRANLGKLGSGPGTLL